MHLLAEKLGRQCLNFFFSLRKKVSSTKSMKHNKHT